MALPHGTVCCLPCVFVVFPDQTHLLFLPFLSLWSTQISSTIFVLFHVYLVSESCQAYLVPEGIAITVYYSCDSNNALQANRSAGKNMIPGRSVTLFTCVSGLWVPKHQIESKSKFKKDKCMTVYMSL